MGDESSLSLQLGSVERSVVFLRQEQLTLLHGLHLEILSLQQRCSESQEEEEVLEEEEELEDRCWDSESCLAEQEYSLGELRQELSLKGSLVGALRANLKEKERHFLEELKRRSHCSTILNTELQKQTEAAAYLSFQLHAARQKLHHQRMQQRQGLFARAHNSQGPQHGALQNSFSQQSPSGASPSSSCSASSSLAVKPKRHGARASSRAERGRECVPVEMVTGPEEPTAMPDPALFLHPRRHRARSRHAAPEQRRLDEEEEDEEGGEGLAKAQGERARLVSSAAAPPAGQTQAE
ncbi:Coiled-coil domain-containing protein 92 [Liparis tanakae]|uniref:Coiled-coil domain-containing protein 92 n=1 Tax=Liparis tanakae TaxID=230148 RepID=A0A4Z2FUQ0_9TELE|nr:Coiled-coil domain-containing protein 92 [Liparis tanakae]